MSQDADGFIPAGQGLPVCSDVYSIGQSADDKKTGAHRLQAGDQFMDEILTVGCTVAGADNGDDTGLVEVGSAFIEQDQRGVIYVFQPLGVLRIIQGENLNTVFLVIFQFGFSPF